MTDYPIKLGSILFTLVEPHEGHEVDYNRWYERDHFYAGCMVGPGILAGKRWVATRPYKDLRVVTEDSPVRNAGSYLALYWVERSQQNEWGTWGAKEVHRLHEQGRMFPHREHIHTRMYRYRWGAFRDADGVPAELALDHPYAGLVLVMLDRAPERAAALERWLREEYLPRTLPGSPAAMCLGLGPMPLSDEIPAYIPRPQGLERRTLLAVFLERDPRECWKDLFEPLGRAVESSGLGRVTLAAPFIPTIPGADRYSDEL